MSLFKTLLLIFFFLLVSPKLIYGAEATVAPDRVAKLADLSVLFGNILAVITLLASFTAFLMVVWGGFRYIFAQEDPKAVMAARGTISWAVVGLVLIIVAWLVLVFIEQFTGINVTKFCIGLDCPIS